MPPLRPAPLRSDGSGGNELRASSSRAAEPPSRLCRSGARAGGASPPRPVRSGGPGGPHLPEEKEEEEAGQARGPGVGWRPRPGRWRAGAAARGAPGGESRRAAHPPGPRPCGRAGGRRPGEVSPLSSAGSVGRAPAGRDNHGHGGVRRAARAAFGKEDFRTRDTAGKDEIFSAG